MPEDPAKGTLHNLETDLALIESTFYEREFVHRIERHLANHAAFELFCRMLSDPTATVTETTYD